jgi:hypothetical protein
MYNMQYHVISYLLSVCDTGWDEVVDYSQMHLEVFLKVLFHIYLVYFCLWMIQYDLLGMGI